MLRLKRDSHTWRFLNLCGILICKIPCNSKILCLNISTLTGVLPCSNSKASKGNSWAWSRLGVTVSSQHADWSFVWSHCTLTLKALAEERKIPDEGYWCLRRFLETPPPPPHPCRLRSFLFHLTVDSLQAICFWNKQSNLYQLWQPNMKQEV